uniref:ATP synthase complex subunit 8 n=1 Tax=Imatidium capense TaxID=294609 RepID=U3KZY8_9CUCU|nr:ATP synthase F0 subunit 8 [Imatidium capense]
MAPINWLLILMFTIMVLIMLNSINYFSFKYKPLKTLFKSKKHINWKW